MANHTGWSGAEASANPSNGDCVRYGTASNTTTSGSASNGGGSNGTSDNSWTDGYTAWVSSGTTAYSAHGKPARARECSSGLNLGTQSALGFAPSDVSSFETGTLFNLGRMVHRNNEITATNRWFRGDMNIQFMDMNMTFKWRLNETPNNAEPSTNSANNDLLNFLNQTTEQTFTSDGLTYTLVVKGFTNNGTDTSCPATIGSANPANQFSTVETKVTNGCLWASVEQVRNVTVKKVVESPYGTAPSQNFAFTTTSSLAGSPWSAPGTASLAHNGFFTRKYNSGEAISITEETQTAPWAFKSLACVDGAGASIGTVTGQTVTIPAGSATSNAAAANITCTYTNTYTPRATLTLVKAVTSTGQPAPWLRRPTGT
nr:choice-of-anchor K domain-containing protein [Tessaracoccus coleopterorum]